MSRHPSLNKVCSARPRPATRTSSKGNHWWRGDVHHLAEEGDYATLCGRNCEEWLTIGPAYLSTDLDDPNLCKRCKDALLR